ncbi:MAG: 2-keto-4-pentenoate hydratase [Rhodospirillaceae bacterium]|nr:2-keto-4-pentenoate hydratase [Rhodospirillaceae bacterium]|tara:strand:+ start:10448 stop:11428 length:981 start_codon:yes stop_codon:yes gene_type:complete
MKLASLKSGRDGALVVVSDDLKRMASAEGIAATMQDALDEWAALAPDLERCCADLNSDKNSGTPFDPTRCAAPLPRAYHWADGSVYLNHMELVRKARGAEMPESFLTDALMYQGGSDILLGACDEIQVIDENWGIDLEAEVAVITDDVPMGVSAEEAPKHIVLILLANDVSLRNLIPGELGKSFGFYQSKPPTAFSPVAVTPTVLGEKWNGSKLQGRISAEINGTLLGDPDAGDDMYFDFGQLIVHAAKTRPLGAGTIIGSGTISNRDRSRGSTCLAEVRTIETIEHGEPKTSFLKFGDTVRIEMVDNKGQSIFGAIDQKVVQHTP